MGGAEATLGNDSGAQANTTRSGMVVSGLFIIHNIIVHSIMNHNIIIPNKHVCICLYICALSVF